MTALQQRNRITNSRVVHFGRTEASCGADCSANQLTSDLEDVVCRDCIRFCVADCEQANVYAGTRRADEHGVFVAKVEVNGVPLPIRRDLRNHSSSFEWGYAGSGPAQLSLAVLALEFGDHYACNGGSRNGLPPYQAFKFDTVAKLPKCSSPGSKWTFDSSDLREWRDGAMS